MVKQKIDAEHSNKKQHKSHTKAKKHHHHHSHKEESDENEKPKKQSLHQKGHKSHKKQGHHHNREGKNYLQENIVSAYDDGDDDLMNQEESENKEIMKSIEYAEKKLGSKMDTPSVVAAGPR